MTFPPPSLLVLAQRAVSLLKSRGETIALAETATGGLISSTILSLPGTSRVFRGSVAAYSLPARAAWLGWTEEDSAAYAGPTEEIVLKLASAVRDQLGATYGLAESGVAGPSRPEVYRAEIPGPGYCPIALVWSSSSSASALKGGQRTRTVQLEPENRSRPEMMVGFAEECLRVLVEVLEAREVEEKASAEGGKL